MIENCLNQSENQYINKLCYDEHFWKNRFVTKFGNIEKNPKRTWRKIFI